MRKLFLFGLLIALPLLANPSGDVRNTGIADSAVKSAEIYDGTITTVDISDSAGIVLGQLASSVLASADVTISSAAMDTLNATPVTLVAAQGSAAVIQVESVYCINTYNAAAFELGSGTLDIRYENSSGGLVAQFTNAWVESGAGAFAVAGNQLMAVALVNKAIVAHASADVTAGGGSIKCRTYYRVLPNSL